MKFRKDLLAVLATSALLGVYLVGKLSGSTDNSGLLLDIRFDEGTLTDNSPDHHPLRAEKVQFVSDRLGKVKSAIRVQPMGSVTVEKIDSLGYLEEFTLCAWVRPLSPPDGQGNTEHRNILSCRNYDRDFNLALDEDLRPLTHIVIESCHYGFCSFQERLAPSTWTHLAVTYGKRSWAIYLNGKLSASDSLVSNPPWSGTSLNIGNLYPGGSESFAGDIDEIRIYGRYLTQEEISQVMGPVPMGSPSGAETNGRKP